MKSKRTWKIILISSLLLCMLFTALGLVISGKNGPRFTGKAAEYHAELMKKGFPEDYANELTLLHLLHPTWEFIPLNVTDLESTYTWDYVIGKETRTPDINLIAPQEDYKAYRHAFNTQTYDSGFYQASEKTVRYFMDPRNFLNEADIFQFYDLSSHAQKTSAKAIDAVLDGTFMEKAVLENQKTYAAYLLELESTLGIDPVYLAVKIRQEQGIKGTSPVISGNCGSLLLSYYENQTAYTESGKAVNPPASGEDKNALLALNGLYNPFNLNASGNGVYTIYKNAMQYAAKGTESMRGEWGSPAWNTMWKGIYGGAALIRDRYIARYQSTVYLQKFNVNPRAGAANNFAFQYMQNVAGAFTEGRLLYNSFAANDMLDAPCRFLIPVFDGMPSQASADPANGTCTFYKPASQRYSTSADFTSPITLKAEEEPLFTETKIAYNNSLQVTGTLTHSYGMLGLEYAWDGGEWISCAQNGKIDLSLPCNNLSYGEHILLIRGESAYDNNNSSRKQNRYFLGAVITVTVLPPPSANISFQVGDRLTSQKYYEGDLLTLPKESISGFVGWSGSDGSFLPAGEQILITGDTTYTAIQIRLTALEGASVSLSDTLDIRFYAVADQEDLQKAESTLPQGAIQISARLVCNNTFGTPTSARVWEETVMLEDQTPFCKVSVDTPAITKKNRDDRWGAEFLVVATYSNGTTKEFNAAGNTATRSATQIAYAALADRYAPYSEETKLALQQIVT